MALVVVLSSWSLLLGGWAGATNFVAWRFASVLSGKPQLQEQPKLAVATLVLAARYYGDSAV